MSRRQSRGWRVLGEVGAGRIRGPGPGRRSGGRGGTWLGLGARGGPWSSLRKGRGIGGRIWGVVWPEAESGPESHESALCGRGLLAMIAGILSTTRVGKSNQAGFRTPLSVVVPLVIPLFGPKGRLSGCARPPRTRGARRRHVDAAWTFLGVATRRLPARLRPPVLRPSSSVRDLLVERGRVRLRGAGDRDEVCLL